jgi:hypothetical protein
MAYRFASPEIRNTILANLAASDAFHDFDTMSRVSAENQALEKNVLAKIWAREKRMGTLPEPTAVGDEDALFEQLLGVSVDIFKTPGRKGQLNMLDAGVNSIQYEWETAVAYEGEEDAREYKASVPLFNTITGDSSEKTLYLMIDAMNVSLHKALLNDKGEKEKEIVYLETRERVNDPADNRCMDPYVESSKDSKVKLSVLVDTNPSRVSYPAISSSSVLKHTLFNSIFSLSIDTPVSTAAAAAKMSGQAAPGAASPKTKEGLKSSTLIFKRTSGATLKTVTVQNGAAENDNTVNSLYTRLVNFFKGGGPTALEDYFIALQQKRSGDWLQVLSSLDNQRFPQVPATAPIFLASLDRLCILYGLCVGANMIYTFKVGNSFRFTVFRRKQKRTAAERKKEMVAVLRNTLAAHLGAKSSLEEVPIADGGIAYSAAAGVYLKFILSKYELYRIAIEESYKAIHGLLPALGAGRFRDETPFNAPLRAVIKPLYDVFLFVRAFPLQVQALLDISLKMADIQQGTLDKAAIRIGMWEYVNTELRELFKASAPGWAASEDSMVKALEEVYTRFRAANREQEVFLASLKMEMEIYNQPALAVFQQLEMYLPASLLTPMGGLFDTMMKRARDTLATGGALSNELRTRAKRLEMNAVIAKYILLKDTTALSGGAIASLSVLLQRVFVSPTAVQKKNAFAIHRVIAKAYQNFVELNGRAALIQAFKKAYEGAAAAAAAAAGQLGGARPKGMTRYRLPGPAVASKTVLQASPRVSSQPASVSGLAPLFLASKVIQEMTYHRDAEPFECSVRLLEILRGWTDPASVGRVYATLPAGIPVELFRVIYYEAITYFVFFMLPRLEKFPGFHPLFSGLDLENVRELGFILQTQLLGNTKEKREVEEELVLLLTHIVKTLPREVRVGDDAPLHRVLLFAIRTQETGVRKSSATRSRSKSGTRKRSRTRSRSRSGPRSRSGSKTRRASKLRRKGSASRSRTAAAPMEMEAA